MRDRAREAGVPVGVEARGGAVAVIQRFGGALNLNVHIHALVLDGVFARDDRGTLGFHATRHLTALEERGADPARSYQYREASIEKVPSGRSGSSSIRSVAGSKPWKRI